MRIRSLLALMVAGGVSAIASAQPAKPAEPTVEVRLQSVNVLLDKAEYVAGLAGKEDVVQGVKLILKNLQVDGKGIEGIDPRRPFGLYATLATDVIGSPVTVMVPVTDQDRFLTMLKERLDITPEKVKGGVLKIALPDGARNPVLNAIFLRFANQYLYIGRAAEDLDPEALIAPKTYFAKDEGAVASVLVRGDRIPAEVKTFITGQFELTAAEHRKRKGNREDPTEKALLDWLGDGLSGGIKSLLDDSQELRVRVFIEPRLDELSAEMVLTPKANTNLARYVSSLAGQTSLPAGIVSGKGAVGFGSVRIAMTPDLKKGFAKVVDQAIAEAIKKVNGPELEAVERALKTLAPTLKAAELDAAATLLAPDASGKYTFLAALAVKDGQDIEKLAKDFAMFAGGAADFTFDIERIGDFNLHKVVLNTVPEQVEKVFGTRTLWVAISDKHIAISIEPEGTAIRAGLKAKPAPLPVLMVEVSLAKVLPLVAGNLKPDEVKALLTDAFGQGGSMGKDTVTVTITGGNQLTAKAKVKGKGVRLLIGADILKAK